jgi:hypothetical protein
MVSCKIEQPLIPLNFENPEIDQKHQYEKKTLVFVLAILPVILLHAINKSPSGLLFGRMIMG